MPSSCTSQLDATSVTIYLFFIFYPVFILSSESNFWLSFSLYDMQYFFLGKETCLFVCSTSLVSFVCESHSSKVKFIEKVPNEIILLYLWKKHAECSFVATRSNDKCVFKSLFLNPILCLFSLLSTRIYYIYWRCSIY